METIFKSAVNHIKAEEKLKKKTREYLMDNLTAVSSVSDQVKVKRPLMKRVVATACAAVCVCAVSISAYAYYKTPTSYLSLDINPSVELGINAFGKVVSATAYNNDGSTILNGQNVYNSDVEDAVNTLVKSAAQQGFVAEDGSTVIAVTSETDDTATAADLQNSAEQGADAAVESEGDTASVIKENVALARRDEARKLGITPGKLNLIQKLEALDSSITVDEYKDAKVTDIMKRFVELKKGTSTSKNNDSSSTSSSSNDSEAASQASSSESGKAITAQSQNAKQNAIRKSDSGSLSSSIESSQPESNKDASSSANAGVSVNAAGKSNREANGNVKAKSDSGSSSSSIVSSQSESNKNTSSNANAGGSVNAAGNSNKEANGNSNHSQDKTNTHKKSN